MAKPRGEMSSEELALKEAEDFVHGPMSILTNAVKTNSQVLIALRNNKKILGRIKAFDRHANMMLEGAKLLWTEAPKTDKGKKKAKPVSKDRYVGKIFLRGDCVIIIVNNPLSLSSL